MASGDEVLAAAQALADARATLTVAQLAFAAADAAVEATITEERQALDAAQGVYAFAQQQARAFDPAWAEALAARQAAEQAEFQAVAVLHSITFDGS